MEFRSFNNSIAFVDPFAAERRSAHLKAKRIANREARHRGYRETEKAKNRTSLKALGLSTNSTEWPKQRGYL